MYHMQNITLMQKCSDLFTERSLCPQNNICESNTKKSLYQLLALRVFYCCWVLVF